MNSKLNGLKEKPSRGKGIKNLAISIVILVEILAIAIVSVFAWVETVSSIKIFGDGVIDTYVFTDAEIGAGVGTIDMGSYFKQSGDMHLAPASSANGTTMFFPQVASTTAYRKGNSSDKNTSYLSATFRIRTDTNADFFFTKIPSFSAQGANIRVSVTSQSEGSNEAPVTQIYALTKGSSSVVNSTTGSTATASVEAFADHISGKSSTAKLFEVAADETKVVTINVWLQKNSTDMNSVMAQDIKITDLGITSNLSPRRITLIPTSTWEPSNTTTYFYAWCFDATNGDANRLYKLAKDEFDHYSFDYSGSYQSLLFFRSGKSTLTTENMPSSWNKDNMWNKTENTSIPASPADPTYVIKSMSGGSYDGDTQTNKSLGEWVNPATVKVGFVRDQSSSCGTLAATSYIDSTTSSTVMETTSSSSSVHSDTVHAWPGKKLRLTASAKTNYRFVGWYNNENGTGNALSTNATYEPTAPTTGGSEVTYYAKFEEVVTVTLYKYVDGASSSVAAGTLNISGTTGTGSSISKTVEKGTTVTISASANTGYTYKGIFTTGTGSTPAPSSFTAQSSVSYYAQFTTNEYNVTANAQYSTNGTSFNSGATGGTVKVGSSSEGATSTDSVKYNTGVTLTASPATSSGYRFDGWYNSSGLQLSTSTTYTYTLTTAGAVNVYARFVKASDTVIYVTPRSYWGDDYYIRLYDTNGSNVVSGVNSTGFVKAEYDSATGYYKATFSATSSGTFYAILAKDTNYTSKVPSTGGYSGTLGNKYIFGTGSTLTAYSNQRCFWFIDGTSWVKNNVNNGTSKMVLYDGTKDTNMTRINDYAYIAESNATAGTTIYFKEQGNGWKNEWSAVVRADKSQCTCTTVSNNYGTGSWTN